MPEPDATSDDDVAAYLDVVAERSLGRETTPIDDFPGPSITERVATVRDQLATAEALARKELALPRRLPGPPGRELVRRLAQVSVTHQAEVNRELIAANRELVNTVALLHQRIDRLRSAGEDLRDEWRRSDLARAGTGVASLRGALDDLAARTDELAGSLVGLDARTATLADELAARRAGENARRNRLGAASPATADDRTRDKGEPGARGPDTDHGAGSDGTPRAELAALLAPESRAATAAMAGVAGEVVAWLGTNGVLRDVASGRGRWLELVSAATGTGGGELAGRLAGWEADPAQAGIAREAGQQVTDGSWTDALDAPGVAPRVVSAIDLAPRLTPDELDTLIRRAATALEPGGTLVVITPRPDGTVLWLDPAARRPVPARLVEALSLAAGFTEVASRSLDAERVAVVVRGAGGRAPTR